jgi:hypothetical protein
MCNLIRKGLKDKDPIRSVAIDFAYLDALFQNMTRQQAEDRPQSLRKVKEELIAHGNEFVQFQHVESLKRAVVPESETDDPLITDPIRAVGKIDYHNGVLVLKLNRPINQKWMHCFQRAGGSSSIVNFAGDKANLHSAEHAVGYDVERFKQRINIANQNYSAQIHKEHRDVLEQKRTQLKNK